ncbi:MAG: AbrB/MazE/SpoVT family DNA-binding domain-containing protein [Candidatus Dormibacteraeota bacterium]|nr:AbrB/MazE/SpoVT family DNA-binding domain-containing protein [Candidatus Dormibacteraeota bacterium]
MRRQAKLTSKGQITIPAPVRRALGLRDGDQVVFEWQSPDEGVAMVRRAPDILTMAGSVPPRGPVPQAWDEERRLAREEAVRRRR